MAGKVLMSRVIGEVIPSVDPETGEILDFMDGDSRVIRNPFRNLLDLVRSYLHIWESGDLEALSDFAMPSGLGEKAGLIGQLDMYQNFITSMYWNSIEPEEGDEWLDFDCEELDGLLQSSFFDEYHRTREFIQRWCRRDYPMLAVYSFARLQAYAAMMLPKEQLWDINYIWTFEDFMYQIEGLRWFETIASVYKACGIHWFANNGENDPIMYKWACCAVAACKKCHTVSDAELKKDLNDIYKELLIAFTIRGTLEKNEDIVTYVQECITNFDEERISNLVNSKLSISMFENFDSFDLAVFPMIRSLEHEFARNYFIPFHYSRQYKEAGSPQCKNKRYEKTHDALVKKGNSHPTMGNIPFIGKAMTDAKAQEASNIIKAFRIFLGDKKETFVSICKTLDAYKLGAKQYKLVDIRNGIAHGNDEVTSEIDRQCYEEVSKLLYEPPIQILFEVVNCSMRG